MTFPPLPYIEDTDLGREREKGKEELSVKEQDTRVLNGRERARREEFKGGGGVVSLVGK